MKSERHQILRMHDEPGQYETPSDFNWHLLTRKVTELRKSLENETGYKFALDDQVQDASFYCDLNIPKELIASPESESSSGIKLGYAIRISNFGFLSTILFQEYLLAEQVEIIKRILDESGFTYFSVEELEEDYDGNFEEFYQISNNTKPDWFLRYFDYL